MYLHQINKFCLSKGNHTILKTFYYIKSFTVIFLLSWYTEHPLAYWEKKGDPHNLMVFSVTKNLFGDCKEHLQLSDSLSPNGQLVKVQPLFYSLNGKFLMNCQASCHACSQSLPHISNDKLMLSQSGRHGEKGCIRKSLFNLEKNINTWQYR